MTNISIAAHRWAWLALGVASLTACQSSSKPAARATSTRTPPPGIRLIEVADTAAYSEAGPQALAAVASCRAPKCRPDIFAGPAQGELTVGLDSGSNNEFQWHLVAEAPPGGQALQDSSWRAMLTHWESSKPSPMLLVDGVPRTYAYAREHVSMSSVWGMRQVSAAEAKTLSSDSNAVRGAIVITTKAQSPSGR
jgi:hypothetical protein